MSITEPSQTQRQMNQLCKKGEERLRRSFKHTDYQPVVCSFYVLKGRNAQPRSRLAGCTRIRKDETSFSKVRVSSLEASQLDWGCDGAVTMLF